MASEGRAPKLRAASSGYGGMGYKIPTRSGVVYPSVTTVTGVIGDGKALTDWAVANTAAYAVANVEQLLTKTEEQGFRMLRFYHTRAKPEDFDDPDVDIHNYSTGVLHDLADLGTWIHEYIEDTVWENFPARSNREEQTQMAEAFLGWLSNHDVVPLISETTVVGKSSRGQGYAGTLDHIWLIDGVPTMVDVKSSKASYENHYAQLAALGAAESMLVECDPEDPEAALYENKKTGEVTAWKEQPLPNFSQYAILRVRPDDVDKHGYHIPAFCRLETASQEKIEAAWESFEGALQQRHGERQFKAVVKREEKSYG